MAILLVLLFFILLYFFYHLYYKRLAYPPGPTPLPLIGNLISLAKSERFEFKFNEWTKKFGISIQNYATTSILGPIYTYWVGDTPIISINDPKLAYQMFVKDGDNYKDRGFS